MRILYLTLDSLGGFGGISQYGSDIAHALAQHPRHESTTLFALHRRSDIDRLPARTRFFCARGRKTAYLLQLLRVIARPPAPQLILCGHLNLLPLAVVAARCTRAPVILFIYGIDAWKPLRSWHSWCIAQTSGIVSISQVTLARFREWAPVNDKPCFVLPNAIDLDRFTPGPKSPLLLDRFNLNGKKVLLTFGRMSRHEQYKGFDEVLNVLPQLRVEFPNLVYVIAGTGDDMPRLRLRAKNEGLEDTVVFTGYVDEDMKVELYRSADVYVMPSRGEGFGFVLLEAAACGIPVIGSTVDGTREALRDGRLGPLVDPDNPSQLAAEIRQALSSERRRPAELEYFAFPNFAQRLHGIVQQMMAPRDRP